MITSFSVHTPVEVQEILEDARKQHFKVRLFYGDTTTGKDWCEENDVLGWISRSGGGVMKVPILLQKKDSTGGPAILTDAIVKIIRVSTGEVLYEHPKYHYPPYRIDGKYVYQDDNLIAEFKTKKWAQMYVDFMSGERFCRTFAQPNRQELWTDLQELKASLFGSDRPVDFEECDPDVRRFQQLIGYFMPSLRTTDWEDPMEDY